VDAALHHLLRRAVLPPERRDPGAPAAHRHAVGRDGQGEGELQLLPGDPEDLSEFQVITGGMIYLGTAAPRGWDIKGITAVVPMAVTVVSHALVPFVLNPSLMVFNY
jgi:hypothetical protein